MRDEHNTVQSRWNFARWCIEKAERIALDLLAIRFLDDHVQVVVALMPPDCCTAAKAGTQSMAFDYVIGTLDRGELVVEREMYRALDRMGR